MAGTVPLTQMATTAETLNQVVAKSVEVLHAQDIINQHPYQAKHVLQQQIDLLDEELTLIKDASLLVSEP